jgi:hypothetical protein
MEKDMGRHSVRYSIWEFKTCGTKCRESELPFGVSYDSITFLDVSARLRGFVAAHQDRNIPSETPKAYISIA